MKIIYKGRHYLTKHDTVALKVAMLQHGIANVNVLAQKMHMSYSRVYEYLHGRRPMSRGFVSALKNVGIDVLAVCKVEETVHEDNIA